MEPTCCGPFSLRGRHIEDVVLVKLHAALGGDRRSQTTSSSGASSGSAEGCGGRGRAAAGGAGGTIPAAAQVAAVIRQRVQQGMHLAIASQRVLLVEAISPS